MNRKQLDKDMQNRCAFMRDMLHEPMLYRHSADDYERLLRAIIASAKDALHVNEKLREAHA